MARFRRSGRNWEGRVWRLSDALDVLGVEVEGAWPLPGPADGTVASRSHDRNSPRSDHRPHPYTGPGVVRALDVGEYVEDQGITLADALRSARDPRLRYLIHEGRLFSSYDHATGPAWSWRPYTGPNLHGNHVHVSVWSWADTRDQPWGLDLGDTDMALIIDIQKALNAAGARDDDGRPLTEDGVWGPRTAAAFVNGLRLGGGGVTRDDVKAIVAASKIRPGA